MQMMLSWTSTALTGLQVMMNSALRKFIPHTNITLFRRGWFLTYGQPLTASPAPRALTGLAIACMRMQVLTSFRDRVAGNALYTVDVPDAATVADVKRLIEVRCLPSAKRQSTSPRVCVRVLACVTLELYGPAVVHDLRFQCSLTRPFRA